MGKIAEIKTEEMNRAFDLVREPDALYLHVKCSDRGKYGRILKIKVSDMLYQIWNPMNVTEKRMLCRAINSLIKSDKSTS